MSAALDQSALIARQRDEIDELQETVRQLQEALVPASEFPDEWRLTRTERRLLSALLARRSMTTESLMVALYGSEPDVDPKIVDVFVCKLRRKLPSTITIKTLWGEGYALAPGALAALRAATAQTTAQQQDEEDPVAGKNQISFQVEDTVYDRLGAAARAADMSTAAYARMLFEAAYAARSKETGDRDLDATVAAALILSGAEFDSEQIARGLRCDEATVDRIQIAWMDWNASRRGAA